MHWVTPCIGDTIYAVTPSFGWQHAVEALSEGLRDGLIKLNAHLMF